MASFDGKSRPSSTTANHILVAITLLSLAYALYTATIGYPVTTTAVDGVSSATVPSAMTVQTKNQPPCPYKWHGGSPTDSHPGSCWCGNDTYCLCTPSLAIDAIIELQRPNQGASTKQSFLSWFENINPTTIHANHHRK